jgi:DNA-binding beta-propeller fold protein YncE
VLVLADEARGRVVAANTLSSSMTFIDAGTHAVTNVPISGRAFQHLKAESMTIRRSTGDVHLVGVGCFHVVSPDGTSFSVTTDAQLEAIAVDEATGNVFVVGRESPAMGFYDAATGVYRQVTWLEHSERLLNANQTPPPPIRKVVADGKLGRIVAVDGFTATVHLFDASTGEHIESRPVPLAAGGRWHLAGYDEGTHHLYIVTETAERKVVEAARIGVVDGEDVVVKLPGLSEGVGIAYNPLRREVYVPYDNHPTVHVVGFEKGGSLHEIAIPTFGNDASAIDVDAGILYIGSWAMGEVDVVDLGQRKLVRRIPDLGIIPHMFTMAFEPGTGLLFFPKGASAVNGTFGAAVTALDPSTGKATKVRTGWAPVDLIEVPSRKSVLVFDSEDRFAEVHGDGGFEMHDLPHDYPIGAAHGPEGDVYLSYGPHQSYWPVVYIWGARDGILTIRDEDLSTYDRRIFRQALDMATDEDHVLYFTQSNWGREEQFIGVLADGVREFQAADRIVLVDEVEREVTQRILEYDPDLHRLYLVRAGEKDEDPSVLQVIDPVERKVVGRVELGPCATDLAQDRDTIYVTSFTSDRVFAVDKKTLEVRGEVAFGQPLKLLQAGGTMWVLGHASRTLGSLSGAGERYEIPWDALPDNVFDWNGTPVITAHSPEKLYIAALDAPEGVFRLLHAEPYPYGDTRFDTVNVSFFLSGQFGDAIQSITQGLATQDGRLWVADFLSGRLFVIDARQLG